MANGGNFLSFNPQTNTYERVSYEQMLEDMKTVPEPIPVSQPRPRTIGDVFSHRGGPSVAGPTGTVTGSVHTAATGLGTAISIADVLRTGSMMGPLGLFGTGYSTFTGFTEGVQRAETFERASRPDATIGDMMAAVEERPSAWDIVRDIGLTALSLATGNIPGAVAGALSTASTVSARTEADEALERATEMAHAQQQEIGRVHEELGLPAAVSAEIAQRSFAEQQAASLAAASTEEEDEETSIASLDPVGDILGGTIGDVMSGTTSTVGTTDRSTPDITTGGEGTTGGSYGDITEGTSRDPGSFGGSFGSGEGGDDRDDSGGYGGFGGGTGAGGFEGDIGGGGFGGYA